MIVVKNLVKEYGPVKAVSGISFEIPAGEIYGLIGPNGAGKTTTINILATILEPTSGEIIINGTDIIKNPRSVHAILGYMPDHLALYDDLFVREYLDFYCGAYNITGLEAEKRIDYLLEMTGLSEKKDDTIKNLSRGMRQRLGVARALVNDPSFILLDEPASGLDPKSRYELRQALKNLKSEKKAILVSSHILSELSDYCTHVGIMERGLMLESGSINSILAKHKKERVVVVEVISNLEAALAEISKAYQARAGEKGSIEVVFPGADLRIDSLPEWLVGKGIKFRNIFEKKDDIEDIYMAVSENKTQ